MPLRLHKDRTVAWLLPAVPLLLFLPPLLWGDEAWRYRREAVLDGQWWRLLSAHFAHLGVNHALLNAAGVVLAWLLFPPAWRAATWLGALLWCALGTGLGLLLFSPEVIWYVGLSGALHGLFVVGGGLAFRRTRDPIAAGIALLVLVKVVAEQWLGASAATTSLIGGDVVVAAHLHGALAGVLFLPLAYRRAR